jgi:hypothetical protein
MDVPFKFMPIQVVGRSLIAETGVLRIIGYNSCPEGDNFFMLFDWTPIGGL